MPNNKILIDASHREETRVVVLRENCVEEFDFESQNRKPLRGNIYLATVARIEPSLQAAFIDYGGNKHGFLAFNDIHPDYYQIPIADRQALLGEEAAIESAAREAEEKSSKNAVFDEENKPEKKPSKRSRTRKKNSHHKSSGVKLPPGDIATEATDVSANTQTPLESTDVSAYESNDSPQIQEKQQNKNQIKFDLDNTKTIDAHEPLANLNENVSLQAIDLTDKPTEEPVEKEKPRRRRIRRKPKTVQAANRINMISESVPEEDTPQPNDPENEASQAVSFDKNNSPALIDKSEVAEGNKNEEDSIDLVGTEDAMEELPQRRLTTRHYRIQEVIKRRQVLLVQAVKEERGNKGASLTTYLSLAGRYAVLMPNTARGGGISRKVTNVNDRKRLKEIAGDLTVPNGMGVILRTAGANRTKAEIKRDFEYLIRLWESVRNRTLESSAPCLVYEEGNLIKRSIRDLYSREISEILVSGEKGYKEARSFMQMLMPSHTKYVKQHKDSLPIFALNRIEQQLEKIFVPQVNLKSGGYLIINQTEALVAIDVNSGRSTKEHSIEDTALQTNLEAAEEIARQLRLRDLAGLVVIDFIDMEEKRNKQSVEKRINEYLKSDRARIQIGRISHFGLLEMSRQRIRASVLESTVHVCNHCDGAGYVLSESLKALNVIRAIQEKLLQNSRSDVQLHLNSDLAFYILNHQRQHLSELEQQFSVRIRIFADAMIQGDKYVFEHPHSTEELSRQTNNPKQKSKLEKQNTGQEDAGNDLQEETDHHKMIGMATTDRSDGERSSGEINANPRKQRRSRRAGHKNRANKSIENKSVENKSVENKAHKIEDSATISPESKDSTQSKAEKNDGVLDFDEPIQPSAEIGNKSPRRRTQRPGKAEESAKTKISVANNSMPAIDREKAVTGTETGKETPIEMANETADAVKKMDWWPRKIFFG